jgi:hypothetical protein
MTKTEPTKTKAVKEPKAKAYRTVRAFVVLGGEPEVGRTIEAGTQIPEGHLAGDLIAAHVSAGDLEEV